MMESKSIGVIGGGRITRIFLQAFRNKSFKPRIILVYDPDSSNMNRLSEHYPEINSAGSPEDAARQDVVILAVHPPVMIDSLNKIREFVTGETIMLSLAPKITTSKMAGLLPTQKIMRMIPNATSVINDGFNPVAFNRNFPPDKKRKMLEFLGILGDTFEVDEKKLEGYAVFSAMLPTYFWFQWKKLEELAVKTGLTNKEAAGMMSATLSKSVRLMYDSGLSYEEVVDLIPVKPIGDSEDEIRAIYQSRLIGLYDRIKP